MMAAASDSESSAYSDASLEALRKEFVEIKVLLEEYEDPRDGLEALRTKLASAEMWSAAEVHYVLTRALGKAVGWVMGKTYSDALFEAEVVPILKVALSLAVEHARTTHEVWSVLTLVFDSAHQCYINDNVGAAVDIDDMEFENEAAFQTKDGRFAAMPKDEFGITRVEYVELLNYFGELGGFDVLYELAGDESLTARDLYGLFHSLNLLRNFLTQECVERTVEQLYASVAARIDGLTEETIRALDPPSLQSAFRQLRGFAMSSLGSAAARRAERKYIKALQARGREAAEAEAAAVPTSTHRHYARDIEHLMLTLSLKYLRSATLPKQVHGANEIKSFILSAEKRDDDLYRLEYGLPASTAKKDGIGKFKSLFTFTEFMLQWLTENEVLELMLRPEAHTEVVKRSETVLRFLSHHERLETRFIDLLWNYSVDKHESDVAVVYDVILAMSQSLSADHCEYIFCKLMELKPEHVAKPQLRLIHYYAANLLQRYQSAALTESDPFHHSALATNCPTLASQHFGVALLWRLAQDGSGVRAEFREQVIQSIQVLLQPRLGEFYRTTYLGNCITAIKQGASVATSLRLLQMILQSFPEPGTVEPPVLDRSQFIEELQQSEQILQLVVHAIELYKREAGPSPPSEANTTEIAARLDVLKFLLENNAKLSLAPADIDTLWALLVEQAADDAERDATFDWLATCCPPCPPISAYTNASNGDAASGGGDDADGEPACLSRESAEYIFVHKLGSMPRQSFSPSALQCMIKYFKYVNAINNVMIVANPKTTPATEFIVLRSAEFHGVKPLWELGIWAESPQVREQVSVFLNSLYSKSVRNDPMVAKHHFLVTAMAYLRDGFTASQQSKQQLHAMQQQGHTVEPAHVEHTQHAAALVERAFTLLESFLEACEGTLAKGDIFESAADEAADNPANKTITVKVHVANGKRFRLQLRPSTTCKRLFNAVARQMDIPPEILRLMSQGITITNTATRSIADLGISDGAKITAVKQVGPASTKALKTYLVKKRKGLLTWDDGDGGASGAPSAAELQQRPSWIISQTPDYFDLMFELLCDTNLMARVWRLICHMPVNKQFEHQMKTLNTAPAPAQGQPAPERVTDWDVLLNMHNQFRLLYGLKIIDGILFPSDSLMHNSREQLQWIGQFVSYGGFGHLTHLLVTFINHMNPAYGPADANRAMERREFNRDLLSYISVGRRALHIALKVFVAFAYNMLKSKNAFVLSLAPPIKPVPATFTINNFDHYFTVVDYPVLVAKLVSVVHEVASTPLPPARRSSDSQASVVVVDSGASSGSVASDGEIVELGSFLAVALLLTGEQEGHHVDVSQLESPTWEQFVQSLVFSLDSKVRAASTDAIFNLAAKGPLHDGGAFERALSQFGASESAPLIGSTLSVLLANMDTVLANPGFRYRSEEYFALLCRCLVFLYSPVAESEHDVGALQQLYVRTWSALDALPSGEVNTKSPVDQLVCGLLSMLRTLFKLCPSLKDEARERGVLDYIYHTCLFDTPTFANTQAAVASQLAVKSGGSEVDAMTLASPPQLPPKCRTSRSRETAFDVILELTADHESNWRFIADKLASAYADAEAPRSWEYDPDDLQRGETGYSGLKNLGCICYMNASVQQLFMIEDFRSKLLAVRPQYAASKGAQDTADRRTTLEDELVEDPMREGDVVHGVPEPEEDEDGHSDSEDGEEAGGGDDEAEEVDPRDDDYFYQLQRIFANLARSDRPFFNPYSFCMSYKDYDGQPVDVSEQMDANEFLNQLFDKIEESLKPYPEAASLIRDTFMGKQVYQTICQECGYVSEREEPFYTLIAEVKNKPTLTESLASYCAGELLTGSNRYNCSGCEKKVNALRRTCIKSLPENLIICLKRFEFNYDIMQKFKINAECRFPTTLNMKPYTTAGLEQAEGGGDKGGDDGNANDDDSCVFELTGIVVHTGIAEAGHYYSYIKEATSSQWFEFNDEDVSPFNPDRIPQQCYGGSEVRQVYDLKLKKKVYKTVDRPNNAYVLVYRRVRRSEGKVDGDGGDGGDGSDGGNNSSALVPAVAAMGPEQLYQLRMQRLQQVPLGDDISKSIWLENTDIARNCRLFDPSYFRFMHKLFQQQEQGPSSSSSLYPYAHREGTAHSFDTPHIQALQLSYNFIVKTLAHAFDKSQLEPWLDSIVAALERDLSACIQLLQHMIDDNSWLINMLLQCGAADTRKGFVRIVMTAVRQLVPYERPYYRANKPFSWAKKRLQQEDDAAAAAPAPAGDEDTATQTTEEGARHLRVAPARSVLVDFVEEVILLLTKASPFWRTFPQYFELLLEFARLGPQERQVLLDRHLVSECIAFVEGTTSPYLSSFVEVELHEKMGTKMTPPKLAPMVELILLLVRGCHTRDPSAPPPSTLPGAVLELDKHDKKRLLNPTFINKMLKSNVSPSDLASVYAHWAWNNPPVSDTVMEVVIDGIDKYDEEAYPPFFCMMLRMFDLRDGLQSSRVETYMPRLLNTIYANSEYADATFACIQFLVRLSSNNALCKRWMLHPAHRPDWAWIEQYVSSKPGLL